MNSEEGERRFEEGFDDVSDPDVAHRLREDKEERSDGHGDVAGGWKDEHRLRRGGKRRRRVSSTKARRKGRKRND